MLHCNTRKKDGPDPKGTLVSTMRIIMSFGLDYMLILMIALVAIDVKELAL
tara:strand:+ start:664 stop:816 length:153 start_codon:yes stop_codon:yes gene_type:complete